MKKENISMFGMPLIFQKMIYSKIDFIFLCCSTDILITYEVLLPLIMIFGRVYGSSLSVCIRPSITYNFWMPLIVFPQNLTEWYVLSGILKTTPRGLGYAQCQFTCLYITHSTYFFLIAVYIIICKLGSFTPGINMQSVSEI